MKTAIHVIILLTLSAVFSFSRADSAEGDAAIGALGEANGIALACKLTGNVARIKAMMIDTVPKTRANGALFEQATNDAFLSQHQGNACPAEADMGARVDGLEARLRAHFKP
ncbi:MAG: hypothetical protein KDE68_07105 [Rhodocyclaceae bacterium]|nr:hypothetical protein [Rhodocyclaceae bacterium]